jgi:ABC-2 type transport system ATP-binding protein
MEITISNLKKQYNETVVLDINELTIEKGDIIGIIGNNGAGKTTLLKLILDLVQASSGNVFSRGEDVSRHEEWKKYTSAYLDTGFLIDFLTPEEYFMLIINSYGKERSVYQKKMSDLSPFMNNEILNQKKLIQDFSSGNKQKIGIIGSILSEPEILILDEPFNFLDPASQFFIRDYLSYLNKKLKTTMIISSHNLECIYEISNRLIVLERGRIIHNYDFVDKDVKEELKNYFSIRESSI